MISLKRPPAGPATASAPTRIQVVDSLRGIALFGILLMHAKGWFDGGALPPWVEQINSSAADKIVNTVINLLISNKFYTLFSFLFGLSFALMAMRSKLPERFFLRRFMWRLIVLGMIGYLHNLHWRGDILFIYVIGGFALIPFRKIKLSVVLICALCLIINLPTQIKSIYTQTTSFQASMARRVTEQAAYDKTVDANFEVFKQGSYWEVAKVNLSDFASKLRYQFVGGHIFITLGFFLLGLYAGRRKLFEHIENHLPFFYSLCRYSALATAVLYPARIMLKIFLPPAFFDRYYFVYDLLVDSSNSTFTIFYIAVLTLLFFRYSQNFLVVRLASVGKTALTNYVSQSIFGTLIFYGYGLGLMAEVSSATAVALCMPIFVFQLFLSHWWMTRFRYGPLEWVWRSLTLLSAQPFRR